MMRINSRLIKGCVAAIGMTAALIMNFEGKSNTVYPDPVGISTICYGHVLIADEEHREYTDDECTEFLFSDIKIAERGLRYVKVDLTKNQTEALVSFIYNVGEGNFKRSTLLRKLNQGDTRGACNELPRWVYSKGIKLRGLEIRREAERQLCLDYKTN